MDLIRDPLRAIQAILITLVPLTFVAFMVLVAAAPFKDHWVNNVSGAVAMIGSALAHCRFWSSGTNQRAGLFWLAATIGFAVLAISQWYEWRIEAVEHALHIEDLDDVLLLLMMPPTILIGLRAKGVGLIVKALLVIGFAAHVVSTGMDILDDWAASYLQGGSRTMEIAVDYSELAFLQLYLAALTLFAATEVFSTGSRPADSRPPTISEAN
ncbi:hypothetical protein [Dongia sp.]|uniref:hypothetical protein n=1 Tax=Dongia sp. TaxID=1977262 RepID=UPI0037514148